MLRVNTRGHDVIPSFLTAAPGGAREILHDCLIDLKAWNDFAESRGFRRILLWGHSAGALKALYYAARAEDNRLVGLIANSPPRISHEMDEENSWFLERQLAQSREMVREGQGQALLSEVTRSATSLLDLYKEGSEYDMLDFLPAIHTPTLLTLASDEQVPPRPGVFWPYCRNLEPQLRALLSNLSGMEMEVVQGAQHFYDGKYDEVGRLRGAGWPGLSPRSGPRYWTKHSFLEGSIVSKAL